MKNRWIRISKPCSVKLLISFLVLLTAQINLTAQTGPGGVGNSAVNKIWLDASYQSGLDNGSSVSSWIDRSGNDWHAYQNIAINRPTYVTSQLNGQSAIRFNRSVAPQFLELTNSTIGAAMSNSNTIFTVSKASTGGASSSGGGLYQTIFATGYGYITGQHYSGYPNPSSANSIQWVGGNVSLPSSSVRSISPMSKNIWYISAMCNSESSSGTNLKGFINGTLKGNQSSSLQMTDYTGLDLVRLGAYSSTGYMAALNGDIAEIIFFNTNLNDAQRIIIDNYLSAKYNLSTTNDFYTGNHETFIQDVQGIGTTSGTAATKHIEAGNGKGLLLSELNNSLNTANEFLICGHGSALNSWISDASFGDQARWERVWYLKKTGTITAKLSFDFSQAGLFPDGNLANNVSDYKLLYRSTIDGEFSVIKSGDIEITATVENGDQLVFSLTDTQLNTGYYTVGNTASLTWTGALDNQWDLPGNWNKNRVPTSHDIVTVNACTTCPTLNRSLTIAGLTLKDASELALDNHTLSVSGGNFLNGTKIMSNGGKLSAADFAEIKNSIFIGAITLEKTAGGTNSCYGGNNFSSALKIINSSNQSWQLSADAENVIKTF